MSDGFIPPPITTKAVLGEVELVPCFRIVLDLGERTLETTPRGRRIHQKVTGGAVAGPRLSGSVYPNGGGEYGLRRVDDVDELFTRFMIVADDGEWLYTQLTAYVREDGYSRFQAVFDADAQGPHAWLNESMFIGSIAESDQGRRRVLAYFEAV